jgi:uncharacterized protein (DUF488 family)
MRSLAGVFVELLRVPGGYEVGRTMLRRQSTTLWQNKSFHNYADYAMGESFRTGLAHLIERGHTKCSAIMCAEALWWRCHRRIIADYLLARRETAFHILGPTKIEPARLTPGAKKQPSGIVPYPISAARRR